MQLADRSRDAPEVQLLGEVELLRPWPRARFGDVVKLNTDRAPYPAAAGIERYVGLEHIEPEDLRIRRWGLVAEGTTFTNLFRPGQVLFGKRRAYQRKVAVADFSGVCSSDIYVLESKNPDSLLPELLPFICQTEGFFQHAVGTSAGSLSPRTNWTQLANYEFALPPLEEQRRIAEVLVASRALLETADAMVQGSEIVMRAFEKAELGRHQIEFPSRTATDLTGRITVGIVVRPADWYVSNGEGVPALRSLNVLSGRLDFSDLVRISLDGHSIHEKSQLNPGDIVVVRSGRPGDAAVIPEGCGPLNCIDLVIATPNGTMLSDYFASFLNSPFGRRQFAAGVVGTAQQHFNVQAFKKVKVPCPPATVQKKFVNELTRLKAACDRASARRVDTVKVHQGLLGELLGARS